MRLSGATPDGTEWTVKTRWESSPRNYVSDESGFLKAAEAAMGSDLSGWGAVLLGLPLLLFAILMTGVSYTCSAADQLVRRIWVVEAFVWADEPREYLWQIDGKRAAGAKAEEVAAALRAGAEPDI